MNAGFCVFWVTTDVLMCTASIWHMCTMSMDRYFTLKYPMRYGRNKTRMMVALKILFVWAVSIAISSPICIYGIVNINTIFNEGLCLITLRNFVIYGSIFAFYIPLSIMIITYVLTIRILWKNQKMMKQIERCSFRPPKTDKPLDYLEQCHDNLEPHVSILNSRKVSLADEGSQTDATLLSVPQHLHPAAKHWSVSYDRGKKGIPKPSLGKKSASFSCFPSSDQGYHSANSSILTYQSSETNKNEQSMKRTSMRNKTPKVKQQLFSTASCSRISRETSEKSTQVVLSSSLPSSSRDLSLNWDQHFHQIQTEMDQCLEDTETEKSKNDVPTQDKSDQIFTRLSLPALPKSLLSDSESFGETESTSTNTSEILTLNLQANAFHMYKLVPTKGPNFHSSDQEKPQEETTFNDRIHSNNNLKAFQQSKIHGHRKSFKQLLKKIKKRNGFHHMLSKKTTNNERKASKVLGIIFAVFVVLWTPFFIINIMSVTCSSCMDSVSPFVISVFVWMGYIASLANPIIYTMFNTAFRTMFIRILKCKVCKRGMFRPDSGFTSNTASLFTDRRNTVTMVFKDDVKNIY